MKQSADHCYLPRQQERHQEEKKTPFALILLPLFHRDTCLRILSFYRNRCSNWKKKKIFFKGYAGEFSGNRPDQNGFNSNWE